MAISSSTSRQHLRPISPTSYTTLEALIPDRIYGLHCRSCYCRHEHKSKMSATERAIIAKNSKEAHEWARLANGQNGPKLLTFIQFVPIVGAWSSWILFRLVVSNQCRHESQKAICWRHASVSSNKKEGRQQLIGFEGNCEGTWGPASPRDTRRQTRCENILFSWRV